MMTLPQAILIRDAMFWGIQIAGLLLIHLVWTIVLIIKKRIIKS